MIDIHNFFLKIELIKLIRTQKLNLKDRFLNSFIYVLDVQLCPLALQH